MCLLNCASKLRQHFEGVGVDCKCWSGAKEVLLTTADPSHSTNPISHSICTISTAIAPRAFKQATAAAVSIANMAGSDDEAM